MAESTQHKLDRVRAPRVQITYDVEIGDSKQDKELPFVVGVMADLSGKPKDKLPRLKERKFVDVDSSNFNDVMKGAKPRATFRVDNKLAQDGSSLGVELTFDTMEDFEPQRIAEQVEPLKRLLDVRTKLAALLTKMDGNDDLVDRLNDIIEDTDQLSVISKR